MLFRPGVAIAACALVGSSFAAGQPPPALHFHHLHLRVADPAAAMAKYTRANGCVETILQGVGVGVRCGQAYLLFDRDDRPATSPTIRGLVSVTGSGESASIRARMNVADPAALRAWIRDRLGVDTPASLTFVAASGTGARPTPQLPDEITHIAFGAIDTAPVLARLQAEGVAILSRTADTTILAGPGGVAIEIVRDAGLGPDAFWCPMHPDVRSPSPGTCPRCGMTLVPIPPPIFGDYRLRVDLSPIGATRSRLTMRVIDPSSGQIVRNFLTVHEKLLHVFLVSRDLQSFQHVHPETAPDGSFTLDVTWPKPGEYMLFADFYPVDGTPQMLQTLVVTPDYRGPAFPSAPTLSADAGVSEVVNGLRVALASGRLIAGVRSTLTFSIADAATGKPVEDLEPYLAAPGHLLVVSADLTDGFHTHPLDLAAMTSPLKFTVTLARPGFYKMWMQFQRSGQVITVPFVVQAFDHLT